MATKKNEIPTIEDITARIRTALENQGTYTSDLDITINVAAGAYRLFLIAQQDSVKLKKTFYLTYTREGHKKYVPHPAIKMLKDTHETVLTSLKSLGLTLDTLATSGSDPLQELVDKVNRME